MTRSLLVKLIGTGDARQGAKLGLTKLVGFVPSQRIRQVLYKRLGVSIGLGSVVYHGCEIRSPANLKIGSYSAIGDGCKLDARYGICIGDSVNLSSGVWIWTMQHDHSANDFGCVGGKVHIDDFVWVSCRTVILPGVTIGKGAVIAAGAVVTKDVEPFAIMGGVPAKKIGERSREINYRITGHVSFW